MKKIFKLNLEIFFPCIQLLKKEIVFFSIRSSPDLLFDKFYS